jgi:chromosome partitioning protein
MKSMVVGNQKGGVGKSAVGVQLVHHTSGRLGHRTLAIDNDHQGNFSKPLRNSGKAAVANFTSSQLFEKSWPELQAEGAKIPEGNLVLIPSDDNLLLLERQGDKHNLFATNFRNFIASQQEAFAACFIDTNPNPDIRVVSSLIAAQYVLSPIQLNQEAIDGIGGLLSHPRVGVLKIQRTLNPSLVLIGLLPNLVLPTPFQKKNFRDIVRLYAKYLIEIPQANPEIDPETGLPKKRFAFIPNRSAIAEAQATGERLWEMKKPAHGQKTSETAHQSARDTWREIEPALATIVSRMKIEPLQQAHV